MRSPISPSYANAVKKKAESSGSSEDDGQFSKKTGRKSRKEITEKEAEWLKMQGSQATIELSFGRSKRNMPIKGGATSLSLGK